jgi:hypothetical protein
MPRESSRRWPGRLSGCGWLFPVAEQNTRRKHRGTHKWMEVEMHFHNFINEPTLHFFTWMTDGGGAAALPGLLAKAFD